MNLIVNNHSILIYNGINLVRQILKQEIVEATVLPNQQIIRFEFNGTKYSDFDIDFNTVKTINEKSFDASITSSATYGNLTVQPSLTFPAFVKELQTHVEIMIQSDSVSASTPTSTYAKRVITITGYTANGTTLNTTAVSGGTWTATGTVDFVSSSNFNDERRVKVLINNRYAMKPDDIVYLSNTTFIINIDLDAGDKITIWTL
ncbi:hypothetical protein HYO65_gp248 [Tenacibaculum phage PTm1]|uniref:Uncharacterized protein n=2 Tax=Shirahamavirus PTm1 TaxID=2846435 RepID=A0A5S9HXE5_9CAUD|nr:hypothetical protein HYO65_gp248 [Tenacibaculum phage PTm1]BBI90640.1 hypothetical protein [Tenacibaculum phage PTm1]BBI90947.1 hypothetical protein [Tenacibaculum phage PTm5]